MKPLLCASLILLFALAACGPTTTPVSAPPTSAPAAATATSAPLPPAPSATAVPATATALPATATSAPPTATATTVPPTATVALASPTAVPSTPLAIKNEFLVNIRNFEFLPREIRIAKGTTVTWMVLQGPHTTTSDDFRTKGPNSWHSGDLQTGQKFSFTFNTPGAYRFFCGFHSAPGQPLTAGNMNGQVIVE